MKARYAVTIALAALLSAIPLGVYAEDAAPGLDKLQQNILPYVQLDLLASRQAFNTPEGIEEMRGYAAGLDPFYTNILYERYSAKVGQSIALNVLLGGLGSWTMGDRVSGAILEGGMVVSWGLGVFALTSSDVATSQGLSIGAAVSSGLVLVGGIVMPIVFGDKWNAKLKQALNM
jgi:hypothetical protein